MLTKNQALYLRTIKEINDLERKKFTNVLFERKIDLFVHEQKVKRLNENLKKLFYSLKHIEIAQITIIKNRSML